jgi:hypothetical protein
VAIPTKPVRGLSAILKAAQLICKLNGALRPVYVLYLTGPELAALDTLTAACSAFSALAPFGG